MSVDNPGVVVGPAGPAGGVVPTTQTQPTTVAGTVYQNTGTTQQTILVQVNTGASGSASLFCDNTANPSLQLAGIGNQLVNATPLVTFVVLPNYYWKITVAGTAAIAITTVWK